jgi:hypothetical protein
MGTRMEQRNVIKQRRKDGNEQEDTPEAETHHPWRKTEYASWVQVRSHGSTGVEAAANEKTERQ